MKRFSIGLIAVLLAIGFAAFTTPQKVAKKTFSYVYKFTGNSTAGENTAANYVLSSSQAGCDDDTPDMVCVIESSYAPDGNNNPQFPSGVDVRNNLNITIKHWQPEL